jgi:Ca2+-binding RTX toxin-like protein
MGRLLRLLIGTALLGASLGWVPTSSAATAGAGTPRCAGQKATIVGDPREEDTLWGTSGPDVIVTNGQQRTKARTGRDLICVTGGGRPEVEGGGGDDRVLVVSGRMKRVHIEPGDGNDVVRGGIANEWVSQRGAHGRDVLRLGAGKDSVDYSWEDRTSYLVADRVYLGPGDDRVSQSVGTPFPSDGALYAGGRGRDRVLIAEPRDPRRPLRHIGVDMSTGTVRADDRTVRVPNVEELRVYATRAARIDYRGTDGDDKFLSFPSAAEAQMLGGDDELVTLGGADAPSVDGGAGLDLLDFGAGANSVTADLSTGTASVTDDSTETYQFSGFENVRAQVHETVRLTGTEGPNELIIEGCDVEVTAGDGDDLIRWRTAESVGGGCPADAAWLLDGGAGDDQLLSGPQDDTLIGGLGTDLADGNDGVDHCEAETRIDCES